MDYLQLILGFSHLVAGGEAFVRDAVFVASRFGVSPLLIGLTLIGFGTSAPELFTSLQAVWSGFPGIAGRNVIGPNIYNILDVMGVTALVKPILIPPQIAQFDVWIMLAATLALIVTVVAWKQIGRGAGVVFLGAHAAYTGWLVVGV